MYFNCSIVCECMYLEVSRFFGSFPISFYKLHLLFYCLILASSVQVGGGMKQYALGMHPPPLWWGGASQGHPQWWLRPCYQSDSPWVCLQTCHGNTALITNLSNSDMRSQLLLTKYYYSQTII